MNKIRKFRIWYRANFTDWPYWRVTYKDGKRTCRLHYSEAKGLADVFDGKLSIDYTVKLDI